LDFSLVVSDMPWWARGFARPRECGFLRGPISSERYGLIDRSRSVILKWWLH
jgi:hypothetical protein